MAVNDVTLPFGWKWSTLADSCEIILGQSPPSVTYNTEGDGLPFFQGKAEFGKIYPTPVKWCSKPNKIAIAGDVLISVRAPVGPTNLCFEESCIGRGLAAIRPKDYMPSRYFFYYLRYIEEEWSNKATGTTFKAITGDVLRQQTIPLAPIAEQERIVECIESLFTQLDAGVIGLKRVQAALKRYRASVLKAACEGRMVTQDLNDESAEEILKRLGKKPLKRDELPELSKGWCWATVGEIVANEPNSFTDGPFGSKLKTIHYTEKGPRVIRLQNIGSGEFKDEYAHISQEHFDLLRKHEIFSGDLVIGALGDSLPRACIIPNYVGLAIVKADCMRFKPHPRIADAHYINYALNSEVVKRQAKKIIHGIGRPRLNQSEVKSLIIPLPPKEEQTLIVAEVERCLSVVQELEQAVSASLKRAERLRQAILNRAFESNLVS